MLVEGAVIGVHILLSLYSVSTSAFYLHTCHIVCRKKEKDKTPISLKKTACVPEVCRKSGSSGCISGSFTTDVQRRRRAIKATAGSNQLFLV
jgi:hypothetical protein